MAYAQPVHGNADACLRSQSDVSLLSTPVGQVLQNAWSAGLLNSSRLQHATDHAVDLSCSRDAASE